MPRMIEPSPRIVMAQAARPGNTPENLKVFLLDGDTVQQAIDKFAAGELTELTFDNACGGHGCHH